MHISAAGQFRHWCHPIAELLASLMFKQTALDFSQGQDRRHGQILMPPLPARNSLFLMLGFGRVIIGHGLMRAHSESSFLGGPPAASHHPLRLTTPCDSLEVILGELIAGGASGFSLSIAGLRRFLLGFVASGGGVGFGSSFEAA